MKKLYLIALLSFLITSCVNPLANMSDDEIVQISDHSLCDMSRELTYEREQVKEIIAKRGVNCNPAYLYCKANSFKEGTEAFASCFQTYYNQESLRQQKLAQINKRNQEELIRQQKDLNKIYDSMIPKRTHCTPDNLGGYRCTTY